MKRLWLLVLAALLLGQGSYAAAGAYCLHEGERSSSAAHWGHHVHAHAGDDDARESGASGGKASFDGDCAFCHAGSAFSPVLAAAVDFGARAPFPDRASLPHPISRSLDAPERPQWRSPALA